MNAACAGVMLLNVRAIGLRPGITGIVAEPLDPAHTLLVKKPDSLRRRCSNAKKKNVRSAIEWPTERESILSSREWRVLNRRKSIARLETPVTQKAKQVSVKLVCA